MTSAKSERFLDSDVVEHGAEHTDHTLARMVRDRIQGIDRIAVIEQWIETEVNLDRGPRQAVIRLLNQRKRFLEQHGERPDLRSASLDERPARYEPHRRSLPPADVTVEKRDGERVPYSRRPTTAAVGTSFNSTGSSTGTEVVTDGGVEE